MSPNSLEQSEIDTLANLLLRSQQARAREALCIKIGIAPERLSFIRDSSDVDFVTQLIYYLDNVGDKEALCKLCCQELFPIFKTSTYKSLLEEIAVKLNCNHDFGQKSPKSQPPEQPASPTSSPSLDFRNINKKLLASGAILLLVLSGFAINGQISQPVVGSKYSHLNELLKARKWQEADNETSTIARTILGKDKDALYSNDLKNFPCSDLLTIEQLWLHYSEKRFGFSKQKQILSNLLVTQTKQQQKEDYAWEKFKGQVDWTGNVISEQNAPDGHFPAIGTWWSSYQPGWLEALFSRVDACKAE